MAHPAWFDPTHYANQKVEQMTDIKYLGRDDWTTESYAAELESWRNAAGQPLSGNTVEDKAYTNFLACNASSYDASVPRSAINVSPNEYFDVGVYLQNLVEYANKHESDGSPEGGWTIDTMLMHLYSNLHMSAWSHYTTVGMFANIDPSNNFNTSAYMKARVDAMNSCVNSDGSIGWNGKNDWTLAEAQQYLAELGINPIIDLYGAGGTVFNLTATASAQQVALPENWNPWQTMPPPNPYMDVEATVEMTIDQHTYTGQSGVNTRFEAVWNNATEESTIVNTDVLHGGENAYNTLAIELDAPWPGFKGQNGPNVTNIGCVELTHGDNLPTAPYLFDARNMSDVERIDIYDNGPGAISLKNLAASADNINLHGLTPVTGAAGDGVADNVATQTTAIEFAQGVMSGSNDSLTIGVDNVGAANAAAGIRLSGVENLTVNALTGTNFINLQNAAGVRQFNVDGGGDIKITNVVNGIQKYDASDSTGIVNMAASDLRPETPVLGGWGLDTLTLTQNFTGAPQLWTNIDYLAINPGVEARVAAGNVKGLSAVWVNSAKNVSLTDLPTTSEFTVYECFANSRANIEVKGAIKDLVVKTADYAAEEGAATYANVISDATGNVSILSGGPSNMGGGVILDKASGAVRLNVSEGAGFSGYITAKNAHDFVADINGTISNGVKFNVVDNSGANGSISLNISESASAESLNQIVLDSDGAARVNIDSAASLTLTRGSSLNALQDATITLDGANSVFDSAQVSMPVARNVKINGGDISLGNLGSDSLANSIELEASDVENISLGKMSTGTNANIITNISANGDVIIDDISSGGKTHARGDAHLTVEANSILSNGVVNIMGADLFINLEGITGSAFSSDAYAALSAAESINFIGASGSDHISVNSLGSRLPSNVDLGDGADYMRISNSAVSSGQNVRMDIDLGSDSAEDILSISNQRAGAKLGVYVDNFVEGIDEIGFSASNNLSAAQAQSLLAGFGVADIPISNSMITSFGSGKGVLYDGNLYGFNASSNATTMVVLTGVNSGVRDLDGLVLADDIQVEVSSD